MNGIEKYLKVIPVSGAITYLFGYLILSTRLSSLNIYIKNFLSLDYLKTGILFIVFTTLLFLVCYEVRDTKNKILRFIFSIVFQGGIILLLSPVIFETGMKFSLKTGLMTFVLFPFLVYWVYFFSIKIYRKLNEINPYNYAIFIFLFILMSSTFANLIFPQIQFRFGGAAPYSKTIYINDEGKKDKIECRVFYENDDWIHFRSNNEKIISLPKKLIEKEESHLDNTLLDFDFNQ